MFARKYLETFLWKREENAKTFHLFLNLMKKNINTTFKANRMFCPKKYDDKKFDVLKAECIQDN